MENLRPHPLRLVVWPWPMAGQPDRLHTPVTHARTSATREVEQARGYSGNYDVTGCTSSIPI